MQRNFRFQLRDVPDNMRLLLVISLSEGDVHMTSRPALMDERSARLAIVEEHVRLENDHNLEGIIQTFGETAHYDDEPWNEHYEGRDQVRQFYGQLMGALPDLRIEIVRRHVADETIILEVIIRGTQLAHGVVSRHREGLWRSLFVVCTPSLPITAWQERESITTELWFYGNWEFSMSRRLPLDASVSSSPIR